MANEGKFYEETERYVNEDISKYVEPIGNIESIACKHTGSVGSAYIELIYEDGYARYFDITGLSKSNIGIMVGHIIANKPIRNEIRDRKKVKEARKLFKH